MKTQFEHKGNSANFVKILLCAMCKNENRCYSVKDMSPEHCKEYNILSGETLKQFTTFGDVRALVRTEFKVKER